MVLENGRRNEQHVERTSLDGDGFIRRPRPCSGREDLRRRWKVNKNTYRLAILLVLISTVIVAQRRQDAHSHSHMTTAVPPWSELVASMDKMHAAMASIKPSGNSDIDFVNLMLPHHQAAIDMARTQLMYGKDPQMRRLAQEIITDQQSEIELMQLWLKQRGSGTHNVTQTPTINTSKER